ncbi:MAG: hypothetical protein FH761_08250 [Firmicutes bacterium]|nr:hypothetical protein [Bacillota bacterium]
MLEGMIKDNIYLTPVNIWNWGVKNLSSHINRYDDNYIKLHLMRSGTATVKESGIEFIQRKYYCKIGEFEEWLVRARNKGRWKVNIRYDKRNMNKIYILDSNSERFIICYLKPEEEPFFNKSFDEIQDYNIKKRNQEIIHREEQQNITNKMNIGIIHDIKESQKTVPKDRLKEYMISNIKENKRIEGNNYGLTQALTIDNKNKITETERKDSDDKKKDEERDYILDMIKNS